MKEGFVAFFCGLLFAIGLGASGMTQPARVTAFLDFTGKWNASLLFVMLGAIIVYAVGYRLVVKRPRPLFAGSFHIPPLRKVDRPLALGSALFGIGWGMAGFCPGPALTSFVSLRTEPVIFVIAMFIGMAIHEGTQRRKKL